MIKKLTWLFFVLAFATSALADPLQKSIINAQFKKGPPSNAEQCSSALYCQRVECPRRLERCKAGGKHAWSACDRKFGDEECVPHCQLELAASCTTKQSCEVECVTQLDQCLTDRRRESDAACFKKYHDDCKPGCG